MPDDLSDRVRAWLASEGYPFELRVGRAFRDAGWDVFHAHHYVDLETEKLREIDVHAAFGPYVGDVKDGGMVGIHLVCECKVSQSKPWVVFTSRHGDHDLGFSSHLTVGDASCRALDRGILDTHGKLASLIVGPRIGHAVTKAFAESRSGDPVGAFSAMLSAISAARSLTTQHYSAMKRRTSAWLSIYLPVVILLGQLFEYYLDDAGNEILLKCGRANVMTYPSAADLSPVIVQIVTADALAEFAATAYRDAVLIAKAIRPKAMEIWASHWDYGRGVE
jgi:hypothetical protein